MKESEPNEDFLNQLYGMYDAKADDVTSPEGMPLFANLKNDRARYSQEGLIAKGGMKEVLKVFDEKTGRQVAMARLHLNSPEELYEPFLREAQLTALLDHPNIISIYDIGLDESSRPYFTMELKNGKSFDQILSGSQPKNQLSHAILHSHLEVFIKICDAISYAHSKGVLHLDLKPENIQVGKFGEVIVCDWGLGKVMGIDENDIEFDQLLLNPDLLNNMTLAGEIRGTPGFMAPEQIKKAGHKTPQTDVYALGAILCTILTGQAPIEGDTETVLNKTMEGNLIYILPASTPQSIKAVISKALSLKPEMRYSSVELLRADVHKYLTGYATEAEEASAFTQLKLLFYRNKSLSLTCFAFITLSLITTAFFIQSLNKSRIAAETAKMQAIKDRQTAENNLKLYLQGQQKIARMSNFRSTELLKEGRIYRNDFFFEDPIKFLEAALEKTNKALRINENPEAYADKGYLLFIKQNFTAAQKALSKSLSKNKDLKISCPDLIDIPQNANNLLSIEDFNQMIQKHDLRFNIIERMIAYDLKKRQNHSSYGAIMESFLKKFNDSQDLSFKYEAHRQTITIFSSIPVTLISKNEYSSEQSILRFLNAERIELRDNCLKNLNELKGMNTLKEVDVRYSAVRNLKPLNKVPALSRIIITKNQFTKEELSVLNRRISIRVK